ncbi:uncharacterized protein usp19 [Narcine bancroftii]|uniref:uncharacterized protein usp19 n=1 Tax=Narcine bancroftii TaxID=1343680 RepID=UPI0038316805
MASTAENGRRRLGRNREEATNKKKLKDKVNQENKDGKIPDDSEARKGLPSNQEALQSIGSDDLFVDWKQNADEVIVKLKSGEGSLKVDPVDVAFTDSDCIITLPGESGPFKLPSKMGLTGQFSQLVTQLHGDMKGWSRNPENPWLRWFCCDRGFHGGGEERGHCRGRGRGGRDQGGEIEGLQCATAVKTTPSLGPFVPSLHLEAGYKCIQKVMKHGIHASLAGWIQNCKSIAKVIISLLWNNGLQKMCEIWRGGAGAGERGLGSGGWGAGAGERGLGSGGWGAGGWGAGAGERGLGSGGLGSGGLGSGGWGAGAGERGLGIGEGRRYPRMLKEANDIPGPLTKMSAITTVFTLFKKGRTDTPAMALQSLECRRGYSCMQLGDSGMQFEVESWREKSIEEGYWAVLILPAQTWLRTALEGTDVTWASRGPQAGVSEPRAGRKGNPQRRHFGRLHLRVAYKRGWFACLVVNHHSAPPGRPHFLGWATTTGSEGSRCAGFSLSMVNSSCLPPKSSVNVEPECCITLYGPHTVTAGVQWSGPAERKRAPWKAACQECEPGREPGDSTMQQCSGAVVGGGVWHRDRLGPASGEVHYPKQVVDVMEDLPVPLLGNHWPQGAQGDITQDGTFAAWSQEVLEPQAGDGGLEAPRLLISFLVPGELVKALYLCSDGRSRQLKNASSFQCPFTCCSRTALMAVEEASIKSGECRLVCRWMSMAAFARASLVALDAMQASGFQASVFPLRLSGRGNSLIAATFAAAGVAILAVMIWPRNCMDSFPNWHLARLMGAPGSGDICAPGQPWRSPSCLQVGRKVLDVGDGWNTPWRGKAVEKCGLRSVGNSSRICWNTSLGVLIAAICSCSVRASSRRTAWKVWASTRCVPQMSTRGPCARRKSAPRMAVRRDETVNLHMKFLWPIWKLTVLSPYVRIAVALTIRRGGPRGRFLDSMAVAGMMLIWAPVSMRNCQPLTESCRGQVLYRSARAGLAWSCPCLVTCWTIEPSENRASHSSWPFWATFLGSIGWTRCSTRVARWCLDSTRDLVNSRLMVSYLSSAAGRKGNPRRSHFGRLPCRVAYKRGRFACLVVSRRNIFILETIQLVQEIILHQPLPRIDYCHHARPTKMRIICFSLGLSVFPDSNLSSRVERSLGNGFIGSVKYISTSSANKMILCSSWATRNPLMSGSCQMASANGSMIRYSPGYYRREDIPTTLAVIFVSPWPHGKYQDWENPGNYRPMSLGSVVGKLKERILRDRIYKHLGNSKENLHSIKTKGINVQLPQSKKKSSITLLRTVLDGVGAVCDQCCKGKFKNLVAVGKKLFLNLKVLVFKFLSLLLKMALQELSSEILSPTIVSPSAPSMQTVEITFHKSEAFEDVTRKIDIAREDQASYDSEISMMLMFVFSFQKLEVTEKEKLLPERQDLSATSDGLLHGNMTLSSGVNFPLDQIMGETGAKAQETVGNCLEIASVTMEKSVTQTSTASENSDTSVGNQVAPIKQLTGEIVPSERPGKDTAASLQTSVGRTNQSKETPTEDKVEVPDGYMNLSFVKYDSYEKGTDATVVHVYVKEICKSTSKVLFREQDFTLIFQTSHEQFLRIHPDCGPNTIFKWQVKVRNLINPEQCHYTFTASRIDICLKKRHNQRWGGLEALAAQVGGAKVAVPAGPPSLDKAQPGSSQHALPPKEEPRSNEKEKIRTEEATLESMAIRPAHENVQVKQDTLVTSPKPTCMVTPMTHSITGAEHAEEEEEVKKVCLPGFTGLVNLGNTCFMNSVIQSLSNTRELRDYFHDQSFESEINYNNPLGTGGRLAIGFAVLLRALWKGTHHAYQPSKLKAIVASKASQFTGYAQHDAQEFMAFLLDGLHEDLNRIQNKPYTETVDSDGRPDEVVAEEAWERHKMRNDSFIVDLFQGQYKSKLVCPMCFKVSITFDPFLYLSVPLPQKQKLLTVFFFAKEPHMKPVKILVSVSKENASATDIFDAVSRNMRVKIDTLRLAEVVRNRFHRLFLASQSLDTVSPSDTLFCFEVLSQDLTKERVVELQVQQRLVIPNILINKCAACQKPQQPEEKLRRCTSCYRVAYCNQTCQMNHWSDHKNQCRPENIGYPFIISVPESRLTYSRLTQLLEGYSRYSVNVFQPPFQPGRISPEPPPSKMDNVQPSVGTNPCSEIGDGKLSSEVQEKDFRPVHRAQITSSVSEPLLASAFLKGPSLPSRERDSIHSSDSGFSEFRSESQEHLGREKETSYEKAPKPEAAIPGYQQPSTSMHFHSQQFYIKLIDPSNKEQKMEDKGDAPLELPDNVSLAMVWKNNERQKEYVLVESKELEYVEDPSSANEADKAGYFTLEQCLNLFTKPEVLAPEEAWYCPKCKQHREASKQLMLWWLPNVLIIQLKRFSFRNFIWRDKINDMVEFPIRNLDLSKFCIGQKDDRQPPVYDLYAVINHYGGMIGGHYTAYARLPNEKNSQRSDVGWRLFDDSTVTAVDESQVVARHAYVLFYRRRNSPVVRPSRTRAAAHGADCTAEVDASASQASSQAPRGADLDSEEAPQLTSDSVSDLFTHPADCAPAYGNVEEVD